MSGRRGELAHHEREGHRTLQLRQPPKKLSVHRLRGPLKSLRGLQAGPSKVGAKTSRLGPTQLCDPDHPSSSGAQATC